MLRARPRKTFLPVLGISAAVLIAGGIYVASKPGSEDGRLKPVPYSNSTYGLFFSYPAEYIGQERDLGTGTDTHHLITLTTKAEPTSITLEIFPAHGNISLEQWVVESKDSHFDEALNGLATTTVGGGTFAVAYSWNDHYKVKSVVFQHKNHIFMASMTYISPDDPIWQAFASVVQSVRLY